MASIIVHEDCGNAPKKLFLKNFIAAIVNGDQAFISGTTTDDIAWNFAGGDRITGKQNVLTELQKSRSDNVEELIINTIITHGYNGAVEGLFKYKTGRTVAFCDVYQFRTSTNNAPIKSVTTYAIPLG